MTYDFLREQLVHACLDGQDIHLSLPGLYAAWGAGHDVCLEGVRRHQHACMHMVLVQLAVGAMTIAGDQRGLDVDEDEWRRRLLAIAPDIAWHLVVDDPAQPALLQPPVSAAHLREFEKISSPDDLTILVASKNHCTKQSMISHAMPWTWFCSLVELQTMSGYPGRFNYGIIRMNGGLGSRPCVAVYPDMAEGARWRRDTARYAAALDAGQDEIAQPFGKPGTLVATWLRAWDGESQLGLRELHPAFVEVCRRVRMQQADGGVLVAQVGNSQYQRIAAPKELCGRTGDPWIPMNGPDKIMTMPSDGWNLHRLRELIVPDDKAELRPSAFQALLPTDQGDLFFHGSVITRGQGKTEGLHEVTILIPGRVAGGLMARLEGRRTLGQTALQMHADADAAGSALRRALIVFLSGGIPPTGKAERKETVGWMDTYNTRVRDAFFPALWACEADPERLAWRKGLLDMAVALYDEATQSLPVRSELFYRAYSKGMGSLRGQINKAFSADKADEQEAA